MNFLKRFIGASSYREAQSWVFMIVNALVIAIYTKEVLVTGGVSGDPNLPAIAGLIIVGVCTTLFTILLVIPTAIIFNRTANDRADERDKRIQAEGGALAFWTVFTLISVSLIAYAFHKTGDLLFHTVLITILIAQFVYACVSAVKYRRASPPILREAQD